MQEGLGVWGRVEMELFVNDTTKEHRNINNFDKSEIIGTTGIAAILTSMHSTVLFRQHIMTLLKSRLPFGA